jgi:hypothetical protein
MRDREKMFPELHDLLKIVGSSSQHECPHNYENELSNIKDTGLGKAFKHHCVVK